MEMNLVAWLRHWIENIFVKISLSSRLRLNQHHGCLRQFDSTMMWKVHKGFFFFFAQLAVLRCVWWYMCCASEMDEARGAFSWTVEPCQRWGKAVPRGLPLFCPRTRIENTHTRAPQQQSPMPCAMRRCWVMFPGSYLSLQNNIPTLAIIFFFLQPSHRVFVLLQFSVSPLQTKRNEKKKKHLINFHSNQHIVFWKVLSSF